MGRGKVELGMPPAVLEWAEGSQLAVPGRFDKSRAGDVRVINLPVVIHALDIRYVYICIL